MLDLVCMVDEWVYFATAKSVVWKANLVISISKIERNHEWSI